MNIDNTPELQVEVESNSSSVEWNNLRSSGYDYTVNCLKSDIEKGVKYTTEQLKALICYWIEYKAEEECNLPWPDGFDIHGYSNKWKNEQSEITGVSLLKVIDQVISTSEPDTVEAVAEYFVDNFETLTTNLENVESDLSSFIKLTLNKVKWTSEQGKKLGLKIANLVASFAEREGADETTGGKESVFMRLMNLGQENGWNSKKIMYRALALNANQLVREEYNKVIRLAMEGFELSREFNVLREMMISPDLDMNEKENVAKLLAKLLGLEEGVPVYESLEKCYAAMSFEKYPTSDYTKPIREKFISNLVSEGWINLDDKALDVATGSGWLTETLKNAGLKDVSGVDVNISLLNKAKSATKGEFVASRWDAMPFASAEYSLVTCLGRSLPHSENKEQFKNALEEMVRLIKVGGTLVFDMPNSLIGTYATNIEKTRGIMKSFGVDERIINDSWVIVDGPKGEKNHFYNRFAPSKEVILKILNSLDVTDVEITEEDIPNENGEPSGDKNLVFICRKTLVE